MAMGFAHIGNFGTRHAKQVYMHPDEGLIHDMQARARQQGVHVGHPAISGILHRQHAQIDLSAPDLGDPPRAAASQAALLRRVHDHLAAHGRVFLTAGAIGALGAAIAVAPDRPYAALRARLEAEFTLRPATSGTFRAMELGRR